MVDWVKLATNYYLDPAVVGLPSYAAEALFTRSLAYSGSAGTRGFVPERVAKALVTCRRTRPVIDALVASELWSEVDGGYQITNWDIHQESLDELEERRRADRERKRRERDRRRRVSRDIDRDVTPMSRGRQEEEGDSPYGAVPPTHPSTGTTGRARDPTGAHGLTLHPFDDDGYGSCTQCGLPRKNSTHGGAE